MLALMQGVAAFGTYACPNQHDRTAAWLLIGSGWLNVTPYAWRLVGVNAFAFTGGFVSSASPRCSASWGPSRSRADGFFDRGVAVMAPAALSLSCACAASSWASARPEPGVPAGESRPSFASKVTGFDDGQVECGPVARRG